jgi:RNA polymerase sigma-70 factor (ECF subfamily)
MSEAAPVPEDLLRHAEFVRRLARSLLSDPHAAEDLVQDTWQASLEHPPRHGGDARGWLARVTRNFARRRWRAQERRRARESEVARPEALPPAEAALEREEMLQRVVQAVRALPEPYRATILARFYEGLSPRDLATREGLSVETVHTRSKRGLASLRRSLERDERAWRPALALLAGESLFLPRRGASLVVHPVMIIKTVSVTATALVVAWGTWQALSAGGQSEPARAEPAVLARTAGEAPSARTDSVEPRGLRERVPLVAAREIRVSGRVVDETGAPVPEARVGVAGHEDPFGGEPSPDRFSSATQSGGTVVGRYAACDAEGRYSATLVEGMEVRVALARSERFEPIEEGKSERWVRAPADNVDFRVRRLPFATLEVRVLEGGTREPLQGFSVAIHGGHSPRPGGGKVYEAGYASRRTTDGVVALDLSVRESTGRPAKGRLGLRAPHCPGHHRRR